MNNNWHPQIQWNVLKFPNTTQHFLHIRVLHMHSDYPLLHYIVQRLPAKCKQVHIHLLPATNVAHPSFCSHWCNTLQLLSVWMNSWHEKMWDCLGIKCRRDYAIPFKDEVCNGFWCSNTFSYPGLICWDNNISCS